MRTLYLMDYCWGSTNTHTQQTSLLKTAGLDGSVHQFNEAYSSCLQWLSQGAKLFIRFKRYYVLKKAFILLRWSFCNCIVNVFSPFNHHMFIWPPFWSYTCWLSVTAKVQKNSQICYGDVQSNIFWFCNVL